MDSDEVKSRLHRLFDEAMNKGSFEVLNELLSENFISHGFNISSGPQGYVQFITILRGAFPDLHVEVENMIAEGDKVASRGTFSGTHKGDFMNLKATGKQLVFSYIDMWRLEDGKFVENWSLLDVLKLMQELGIAPQPDQE